MISTFVQMLSQGDDVRDLSLAPKLKLVLAQAAGQSNNEDLAQAYQVWVQHFSTQLMEFLREMKQNMQQRTLSASLSVETYQRVQEEWMDWIANHVEPISGSLDFHKLLCEAKVQEEQEREEFRKSLSSEQSVDAVLEELEKLTCKSADPSKSPTKSAQYHKRLDEIQNLMMEKINASRQLLEKPDACSAFEVFEHVHLLVDKLDDHLSQDVKADVKKLSGEVWSASLKTCGQLRDDIAVGCPSSGQTVKYFQQLCEQVRMIWPWASQTTGVKDSMRRISGQLHTALANRVEKDMDSLHKECERLDFDSMKLGLEQVRRLATAVLGGFGVYAEDAAALLGEDASLVKAQGTLRANFAKERGIWEVARSLARLELAPHSCSEKEIERQKRHLSRKHHPDRQGQRKGAEKRGGVVMPRINNAVETLLNSKEDRQAYQQKLRWLLSDKVHAAFKHHLEQVNQRLGQNLYGEVKDLLHSASGWRVLEELVNPSLDVKRLETQINDAVQSHANEICSKASEHFENKRYKSLEKALTSLVDLSNRFGASQNEMHESINKKVDEVKTKLTNRLKNIESEAKMQLVFPDDRKMEAFAGDLIQLGLVWCEISSFKTAASESIAKLLNTCLQDSQGMGMTFMLRLGKILAKQSETEGETRGGADGTMSHAAVAQHIVHEFGQFKAVQTMMWNESVSKMQKDPEACVKEMSAKGLADERLQHLNSDDLKAGLDQFFQLYDALLDQYLDEEISLSVIIRECLDKVEECKTTARTVGQSIEVFARPQIPDFLAYVFMHYTIVSSGESYVGHLRASKDKLSSQRSIMTEGIRTPHNVQVLAILRFFGFGDGGPAASFSFANLGRLANQLVQVRTGEGKSLILGSAATLFALLGFNVCCVCYSAHLSRRDFEAFKQTFQDFQVNDKVRYSKITAYSESVVSAQGDIRSLTLDLLRSKPAQRSQRVSATSNRSRAQRPAQQNHAQQLLNSSSPPNPSLPLTSAGTLAAALPSQSGGLFNLGTPHGAHQSLPPQPAIAGSLFGVAAPSGTAATTGGLFALGGGAGAPAPLSQPLFNLGSTSPAASQQVADQGNASYQAFRNSMDLRNSQEVLLIDEVDVFWGPDFHGKTHNPVAQAENPHARAVLETLWARRREVSASTNVAALVDDVKKSPAYTQLLADFRGFDYVIEAELQQMCADLQDYLAEKPPLPIFDESNGGRVGYEFMDGIEYDFVCGYKTAFAYLQHKERVQHQEQLGRRLVLQIPCGNFLYGDINPRYMFGVSGTVEQLEPHQRQELTKHSFSSYTCMPSVYGTSRFSFLEESHAIKISKEAHFHHDIALAIQEKLQARRAVIVFFKDGEELKQFRRSSYCGRLPPHDVLEGKLSDEQKDHIIKKAANTGQLTLSTAIFGRGSDFVCYDEQLHGRGGLHVLQTFASLDISEEVQIQGRTARQGKKGTYSLVLREDELLKELGLHPTILNDGQNKGYESIKIARRAKQEKAFASMKEAVRTATEQDKLTREYFADLTARNNVDAVASFDRMYRRCFAQKAFHYILCLDRSGSMAGMKFSLVQQAAVNFVNAASKLPTGTKSVVSLIMFDHTAQVLLQELPLERHAEFGQAIVYSGGRTDFGPPLLKAMGLIGSNMDAYQRHCILLYTDGYAPYPTEAVQQLQVMMHSNPSLVEFFSISEDSGDTLAGIAKFLYSTDESENHTLKHVQPEHIAGKMIEVLQRVNMGYVRQS